MEIPGKPPKKTKKFGHFFFLKGRGQGALVQRVRAEVFFAWFCPDHRPRPPRQAWGSERPQIEVMGVGQTSPPSCPSSPPPPECVARMARQPATPRGEWGGAPRTGTSRNLAPQPEEALRPSHEGGSSGTMLCVLRRRGGQSPRNKLSRRAWGRRASDTPGRSSTRGVKSKKISKNTHAPIGKPSILGFQKTTACCRPFPT